MKSIEALQKFCADDHGVSSIFMLCLLPAFLMIAGLGMDGAAAFRTQEMLQSTADSAATAAAFQLSPFGVAMRPGAIANATAAAFNYTKLNMPVAGFGNVLHPDAATNGDIVFGNWNTDTFAPNGYPVNAVRVTVRTAVANSNPYPTSFLALVGKSSWDIVATAVASAQTPSTDCALALNAAKSGAIGLTGSGTLSLPHCGLAANSSNPCALNLVGSGTITAASASLVGGHCEVGSGKLNIAASAVHTGAASTPDPYTAAALPSFPACTSSVSFVGSSDHTLSPGSYCGISIAGSGHVTLQPGTYFIDDGSFSMAGSGTLTGNGVTIVLSTSSGSGGSIGTFSITGSATVNLTAQSSGQYSGLVVYQDPRAPTGGSDSVTGSGTLTLNGTLYFPQQELKFTGSSSAGPGCTLIIADTITIVGSAGLDNSACAGIGAKNIGNTASVLVE